MYFTANLPSPIERQLFWVSLDEPGKSQSVTSGAGRPSVTMSANARVFVDTFSNTDTPRRSTLRRSGGEAVHRTGAQQTRCDASVCALSRRTRAGGVRHDRGGRRAADVLQAAQAAHAGAGQALPGADRRVRRTRRATREQQVGQPVPSIPGAARLRGVRARQSRQRLSWHEVRDRAGAAHGRGSRCRTRCAGVEFLRSLPFVDGNASVSSAGVTAATWR